MTTPQDPRSLDAIIDFFDEELDGGEFAFPVRTSKHGYHTGMSIRDWFAGMALQGVLSNSDAFAKMKDQQVAECAYAAADAMLAARKGNA